MLKFSNFLPLLFSISPSSVQVITKYQIAKIGEKNSAKIKKLKTKPSTEFNKLLLFSLEIRGTKQKKQIITKKRNKEELICQNRRPLL